MSLEEDLKEFYSMAGPTIFDQRYVPNIKPNVGLLQNDPLNDNYSRFLTVQEAYKRVNNSCFLLSKFVKFYNLKFPETKKLCPERIYNVFKPSYALNENKPENNLVYNESVKNGEGRIKGYGNRGLNSADFPNSGVSMENLGDGRNIVIVGGGPIGLYMAGLIKMCDPELQVILIEKRVSPDRLRKLERKEPLLLATTQITGRCVDYIEELLRSMCPVLKDAMITIKKKIISQKPKKTDTVSTLSLLDHVLDTNSAWVNVNYLEYKLASFAQSIGVVIFHDHKMDSLEYLEKNYINEDTMIVFDATGGRLVKSANINSRFPVTRRNTRKRPEHSFRNNKSTGAEAGGGGAAAGGGGAAAAPAQNKFSFNVKEGYLTPEQAITRLPSGCLYAAIGDTYLRVDYKQGRNVLFGANICFCIALIILQHL